MGAYYRRTGEDRATEVVATVFQRVPAFIAQLADCVHLPPADSYEVSTQVDVGCIIDLEIRARAADDQAGWLLWSEHKVADPLTVEQLVTEATALELRAAGAQHKLIAITLYPPSAAVRAHSELAGVTLLRWKDLVDLARRALHELDDTAIDRPERTGGSVEIERHLLLEWCAFCEHELEAPVEPLTDRRIAILAEADKAWETLEHLLEVGFRHACEELGTRPPRFTGEEWQAPGPSGTWLADQSGKLYARYDVDDSWTIGGVGGPAFTAGMWVEGDDADALRTRIELRQRLREQGFSCWDEPGRHGYIALAKTLPLVALLVSADVQGQESAVRGFCFQVLSELLSTTAT